MDERFERGLKVRKEILGAEVVEANFAKATDFDRPLQEMVTACCWGTVWTRDELDRRTRSLVTVAMLAVLNRPDEMRAHLRAARINGATEDDIREVPLQAGVYGGIPCGVAAFRIAKEVLFEGGGK